MKTLRAPKITLKTYQFVCHGCTAIMQAERDEGRFVHDARDGDAVVFVCPHCQTENWVH